MGARRPSTPCEQSNRGSNRENIDYDGVEWAKTPSKLSGLGYFWNVATGAAIDYLTDQHERSPRPIDSTQSCQMV